MTADRPDTGQRSDPGELVDRVRSAVLAVPGVADLSGGIAGEIATYLPGRRVPGVRLTDDGAEVHLVVEHRIPIPALAAAVHRAVQQVGPRRVDVYIDDLRDSGAVPDQGATPTPASR